jgi:DNA-binding response OmpR family regulator
MLTNLGTDEDKKKGEEFGATDYLVKASLTPSQVSAAIKKYLK